MNRYQAELYHHGIKGQRWGVRRYQNPDGSLTPTGKKRYGIDGLDASKRDDVSKLSDRKKRKVAKKELKKLYRKIDRRSGWDELQAEGEKDRRSQDYRQKKAEDQSRQIEREMEKKKWESVDEEEDEWWLDDDEKAIKAQQKELQRGIDTAKREAFIKKQAENDMRFESKNEKQYQEELQKIQKGKEAAKRQVDDYISKKYGLSKASVSTLNGSSKVKNGSSVIRFSNIQSLMNKPISVFDVD